MNFFNPSLLVGFKRHNNNDTGTSFVAEYEGTEAQMMTVAANYEVNGAGAPLGYGYKTSLIRTAGKVTGLTVLIPDEILYTERWNRSTEVVSTSIWASYYLQNFLGFTSTDPITSAALDDSWHRRIGFLQKGVSNRRQGLDAAKVFVGSDALTAGGALAFSANEIKVINLVMRSGEYMTIKRPVLTRQRYVPVASNERSSLFGIETLYTTQELVDNFNIPDDIAALIATVEDDLPPARPDTLWSWKSRCDDQTILLNSGKWDERRDWVFDLWSTITHKTFVF